MKAQSHHHHQELRALKIPKVRFSSTAVGRLVLLLPFTRAISPYVQLLYKSTTVYLGGGIYSTSCILLWATGWSLYYTRGGSLPFRVKRDEKCHYKYTVSYALRSRRVGETHIIRTYRLVSRRHGTLPPGNITAFQWIRNAYTTCVLRARCMRQMRCVRILKMYVLYPRYTLQMMHHDLHIDLS